MTEKQHCDRCGCEVDKSGAMDDGSYRCDECFTFFAELNWNDPDDRAERVEAYLERRKEEA